MISFVKMLPSYAGMARSRLLLPTLSPRRIVRWNSIYTATKIKDKRSLTLQFSNDHSHAIPPQRLLFPRNSLLTKTDPYLQVNPHKRHALLTTNKVRLFTTTQKNLYNRMSPEDGFQKVRYYRLPIIPFVVFSFLSFAFCIMIIPMMIRFLFPLILVGIVYYQFKHWRTNQIFDEIMKAITTSDILVPRSTITSLQYRFLSPASSISSNFTNSNRFMNIKVSEEEINNFVQFVETRIMESFAMNEAGIRKYYFNNNRNSGFTDRFLKGLHSHEDDEVRVKIDSNIYKAFGKKIGNDNIKYLLNLQYPLSLLSRHRDSKNVSQLNSIPLGNIIVTFLDDTPTQGMLSDSFPMWKQNKSYSNQKCPMVISVIPDKTALIPKQFIISTLGDSGHMFNKYKITNMDNGSREYTIRDNS